MPDSLYPHVDEDRTAFFSASSIPRDIEWPRYNCHSRYRKWPDVMPTTRSPSTLAKLDHNNDVATQTPSGLQQYLL